MLESLTIFTKGGLILYQYNAEPSMITGVTDGAALTRNSINGILKTIILEQQRHPTKTYHITEGLTFLWRQEKEFTIMAMYPDILFEGPRVYLKQWAQQLVDKAFQEYSLYFRAATAAATATKEEEGETNQPSFVRPDPKPFDETFRVLLQQSKSQKPTADNQQQQQQQSKQQQQQQSAASKGKEKKRQWHDGNAKVTDKAMEELDMSSKENAGTAEDAHERALQEARQAYLPNPEDLKEDDVLSPSTSNDDTSASWSSAVTGVFQQLTGSKVLQDSDLDGPLKVMQERLVSKNVANTIAATLCQGVRESIRGKRLNSLYRVQTAVKEAMEVSISKLLQNDKVDLLRAVYSKRGDGSLLGAVSSYRKRAPYVITVMGINGIGKTTSLAKLAYYFQKNGCQPLLVAGDTFRSGAVEQLRVHADCLQIPLFSQGYSKDPSAVAKAAIQHATENCNDVVLIDTAGRMQNNVPLMKALGKLIQENKPDFIIMVCEALVGHDGLDQFNMFKQAMGYSRTIDGLIMTKFDTVSDKVGAALTLTHETGAPIVFCGTGQKYHHLKKLNISSIIDSLMS